VQRLHVAWIGSLENSALLPPHSTNEMRETMG
jgi:hypothetical protein